MNAKLAKRLRAKARAAALDLPPVTFLGGIPSSMKLTRRLCERTVLNEKGEPERKVIPRYEVSYLRNKSARGLYLALKEQHGG